MTNRNDGDEYQQQKEVNGVGDRKSINGDDSESEFKSDNNNIESGEPAGRPVEAAHHEAVADDGDRGNSSPEQDDGRGMEGLVVSMESLAAVQGNDETLLDDNISQDEGDDRLAATSLAAAAAGDDDDDDEEYGDYDEDDEEEMRRDEERAAQLLQQSQELTEHNRRLMEERRELRTRLMRMRKFQGDTHPFQE